MARRSDRSAQCILVTGGAGYIGSHACKALSAAGYVPVTFDNLSSGRSDAVKWGPLVIGDVLNRSDLDNAFLFHRPFAVMHFAARIQVGESLRDPGTYYRENVAGSLTLMEAMRDHGCNRMIFSSTCATYGQPRTVPVDELEPQNPINPYGTSKLVTEFILKDFARAHGLTAIALRYFNAAGADPEGEIGWHLDPPANLIPIVLDAASGRTAFVNILGRDYPTVDGTCIRDYVHVSDLAEAHRLALEAELPEGVFEAFNLGTGSGYSVIEVIEAARRCTGQDIRIEHRERRPGDPPHLVSGGDKAMRVLGWTPKFSDLDTILLTSWHWHRERFQSPRALNRSEYRRIV